MVAPSANNPLDPAAVIETLARLVQPAAQQLASSSSSSSPSSSSTSAGPSLSSPQDGLAAFFHAALTRLDFRLVGLAEDDRLSDHPAAAEGSAPNSLPLDWNKNGPESYVLRYRHDQSSLTFLLKLLRMSSRVLVHASAVESNKTATWEIPLADFTSTHFFPYPKSGDAGPQEPLINGFISTSRAADLISAFKGKIIQTLIPGLRKDGYEEAAAEADRDGQQSSSSAATAPRSTQQPPPRRPPYTNDPDDPALPSAGPYGAGGVPYYPGRNPLAIGDRDLDPLGGARPPGAGYGPPPLFGGGGGGGGGMYVGPDDPIFRDRFRQPGAGGIGPEQGPWGGDGFLPPGAVPPGARFDPVGPFGQGMGGPFGPGGVPLGGGPGQPRPRGGPAGDPDWDDVRPPRGGHSDYDNMFM